MYGKRAPKGELCNKVCMYVCLGVGLSVCVSVCMYVCMYVRVVLLMESVQISRCGFTCKCEES